MGPQVPTEQVDEVPADAVLLDVREQDEWDAGHAEGALHVPMGQVPQRVAEIDRVADGRRVHVVCRSGGRSAQVTGFLVQHGTDAVNVAGGMHAWADAGRGMVADGAAEPYVA